MDPEAEVEVRVNDRPTADELEQQKKHAQRRRFLRAQFEGKLTPRWRPKVSGFLFSESK
jgi:hypothetical protein